MTFRIPNSSCHFGEVAICDLWVLFGVFFYLYKTRNSHSLTDWLTMTHIMSHFPMSDLLLPHNLILEYKHLNSILQNNRLILALNWSWTVKQILWSYAIFLMILNRIRWFPWLSFSTTSIFNYPICYNVLGWVRVMVWAARGGEEGGAGMVLIEGGYEAASWIGERFSDKACTGFLPILFRGLLYRFKMRWLFEKCVTK